MNRRRFIAALAALPAAFSLKPKSGIEVVRNFDELWPKTTMSMREAAWLTDSEQWFLPPNFKPVMWNPEDWRVIVGRQAKEGE